MASQNLASVVPALTRDNHDKIHCVQTASGLSEPLGPPQIEKLRLSEPLDPPQIEKLRLSEPLGLSEPLASVSLSAPPEIAMLRLSEPLASVSL